MTIPFAIPLDEPGIYGRQSELALHLRAADISVYGTLRGTPVFARAGEGYARDSLGLMQRAAHSQPRIDYWDLDNDGICEQPTLAFDDGRTNLCPYGSLLTSWALVNAPSVVAAAALGDLPTWKVSDTSATLAADITSPNMAARFATAGNGVLLFAVALPDSAAASGSRFILRDVTLGANRLVADITWVGTTPSLSVSTGTFLWMRLLGTIGGKLYWEVAAKAAGTVTTSDHQVWTRPAITATQTGDLYCGPVQVEDVATCPLPLVDNVSAGSASAVAESWKLPFDAYCGPATFWLDFIEMGSRYTFGARLVTISDAADAAPFLYIDVDPSGRYRLTHHNGTAAVLSVAAVTPDVGDRMVLYGVVNTDGSVQLTAWRGGIQTTGTLSGALAFGALGWSGFPGATFIHLGHAISRRQATRLVEVKIALGARSPAGIAGSFGG